SYSVSHDLRAPLRHIDGYSKMLMEDFGPRLEPEAQRLLGVIREATGQMSQLIDALLRFARLGRGAMRRSVTDLGTLAKQEAAKFLGLFQRLHRQQEFEGIGLGLAAAARIVRRHGGRIWAKAAPGSGATFFFTLDDDEPAPAALPANHLVATGEVS